MIERPASTSAHRASRKLSTVAGRSCLCPGGAATTCWPNGRIVSSKVGSVRRAGNFKCWSTGEVCRCASSSNRLASKTAVARRLCSTGSATASLRSNSYAADRRIRRPPLSRAVAEVPSRHRNRQTQRRIKRFVVLARRCIVERNLSWFGRNRRLAKRLEYLARMLQAFVALASRSQSGDSHDSSLLSQALRTKGNNP
jgi:hypothetical protein